MYVYEIPSRVYRVNYRSIYWQYGEHRHRISREAIHLENQVITKLLLIAITKRLGKVLSKDGEQALLRSLVKVRFCSRSNKRFLTVYAKNPKDAFTLVAHWSLLSYQMQKLLSHEGFLAIYQGVPEECQEVLTIFVTSNIAMPDSV